MQLRELAVAAGVAPASAAAGQGGSNGDGDGSGKPGRGGGDLGGVRSSLLWPALAVLDSQQMAEVATKSERGTRHRVHSLGICCGLLHWWWHGVTLVLPSALRASSRCACAAFLQHVLGTLAVPPQLARKPMPVVAVAAGVGQAVQDAIRWGALRDALEEEERQHKQLEQEHRRTRKRQQGASSGGGGGEPPAAGAGGSGGGSAPHEQGMQRLRKMRWLLERLERCALGPERPSMQALMRARGMADVVLGMEPWKREVHLQVRALPSLCCCVLLYSA